ncbi:MAG TPA: TauD/TfdA family dioxygenase [Burkholderiales bacterium]|nr:TauD/TfdA family dioxygenase [Burkholderiales bacterium]
MEIRRLGPIGAEILGADVRNMDDAAFAKIYATWLEHNVICVRDQTLTLDDYVAYSRRFGRVLPHPSKSTRHPDCPEITLLGVNKYRADGTLDMDIYRRGAEGFHTDGSYEEVPFKATQLYALAIPSRGGDTHFSSAYALYDAVPKRIRDRVEDKCGLYVYGGRKKMNALLNPEDRNEPARRHPLVQLHKETGRKLFYFDQNKILSIDGLPANESDAIIAELTAIMQNPPAQYSHKWRKGDIVIWDNRCSYHKAAGDYPPEEERIHWRVSIKDWVRDETGTAIKDRAIAGELAHA